MRKTILLSIFFAFTAQLSSAADLPCDGQEILNVHVDGLFHDVKVEPNCVGLSQSGWVLAAVAKAILEQRVKDNPGEDPAFAMEMMLDVFIDELRNGL